MRLNLSRHAIVGSLRLQKRVISLHAFAADAREIAMPSGSTEDYFSALGSVCDTWNIDTFAWSGSRGGHLSSTLFTASVKTSALSRSEKDGSSSTDVLDYFWLQHDIAIDVPQSITTSTTFPDRLVGDCSHVVTPPFGNWTVRALQIEVRQWDTSPDAPRPPANLSMDPVQSRWGMHYTPLTPTVMSAHTSRCVTSSPQNQIMSRTEGTSISQTISASAGFFGDTPTGSIGVSTTTEHSTSRALPDIDLSNLQQHNAAIFRYSYDGFPSEGQKGFQPTVQHIFSCDDDLMGPRSASDDNIADARCAIFMVILTLQVDVSWPSFERMPMVDLYMPIGWDKHDPETFTTVTSRLIRVPAPPLPKGVAPRPWPASPGQPA